MGLETSEPVLEPWFVNRAPGSARRDLRAGICLPGARAPSASVRHCPGARFRAAIVQRHIAHGSLKLGGLVRARCPRSARRCNVLARTMRDKLAPAIAPWAGEDGFRRARVCFRARVFVLPVNVQWRKGPRHLIPSTIPMTYRDRSENLARVGEGRWLRLCFTKIIP
jgi:hypothetical protein